MKAYVLLVLILLSACSKETEVLRSPNQPVTPPPQTTVDCSGNLADGSLLVADLDAGVNSAGAVTASASFILGSNNKCIIQSCDASYNVANDGLSCSPVACTVANSGIAHALSVSGDLVNGCLATSCQTNYSTTNGLSCDPIACTLENSMIANAQTVNGDLVNGCNLISCQGGYAKVGNVCQAIACTTANAGIANALSVTGTLVSGCQVTGCQPNYQQVGNTCQAINCTPANSGIANVLTVSGTLVSGCNVTSCQTNYQQVGNTCQAINCTPANSGIANVLTVSGTLVSGCNVTSCQANYQQVGNTCQAINCTPANAGISNALTVSGTLVSGCNVETCQSNYEKNGNTCQAINCTPANSGIANVLTVSGTLVTGCSVTSCQTNYEQVGNICQAISCTPANSGIAHATSVSGTLVSGCTLNTCETNYEKNGNVCSEISCTPANSGIDHVLSVSGTLVTGCNVESCQTNYEQVGNTCQAINCSVANANIDFAATVSGTLVSGCQVESCVANYEVNTATNSCNAINCSVANAGIDHSTAVSGTLVSGCTVESCATNYQVNSLNNSCDEISCTPANSGIANVLTVTGTLVNGCLVDTCQPNYEQVGNTCQAISCTVANAGIDHAAIVSGDLVSGCTVNTCENNYEVFNNTCQATMCTTANAGIDHATSVDGLLISGCTVQSCETNYEVNSANNSCDAIACTVVNSGIDHADQVYGNLVNGCFVLSCSYPYEADTASNSCQAISCTTANANIDFATIVSGNLVAGCNLEECEANYDVVGNSCEATMCTTANAGIDFATQVTGTLVSGCTVTDCENNYEVNSANNSCDAIACTVANAGIDHAAQVYGNLVSGCFVMTCDTEYTESNNQCVGESCTLANAQGNGVSSIAQVLSVTGTINNDSCLVNECNPYYKKSADSRQCDAKNCNELNASEVLNLGFNTTNGTLSGLYPSCTLSCNLSSQQLAADGKSCEDKTPTVSVAFDQAYTKVTTNLITINYTDGQNLNIYSDSGCTTSILASPLTTSPVSFNITTSAGDGIKTVYVQVHNGTKHSNCAPASITYDITNPSVTIASPATGSTILSNLVTITGACTDATSGVATMDLDVGGIISHPTCSGGTYTGSADVSTLNDGSIPVMITAHDNSTNQAYTTITLNKQTLGLIDGSFNGAINTTARQPDGKLVVGGAFSTFTNTEGTVYNANGIARLNTNGTIDTDFSNNIGTTPNSGFNAAVQSIATDAAGNIYVGGLFTSFKNIPNNANKLAKLKPTGEFDQAFSNNLDVVPGTKAATSGFDANIFSIALDSTGNLYVGGLITSFKGTPNNARGIAKLSTTGVFNQAFSDNMDATPGTKLATSGLTRSGTTFVYTIVVDSQNNVYVGGNFESFKGIANNANKIAKFKANGDFDTAFSDNLDITSGSKSTSSGFKSGAAIIVNAMAIDSSDNLYVVGRFTAFKTAGNYNANRIAKLSSSGVFNQAFSDSLDVSFGIKAANSGFTGGTQLSTIAIDRNNNLIVGGNMTTFKGVANNANGIAKLTSTGGFIQSFSDNLDVTPSIKSATTSGFVGGTNGVTNITTDASNNIYAAGDYTSFKGTSKQFYIKLLTTGLEPSN